MKKILLILALFTSGLLAQSIGSFSGFSKTGKFCEITTPEGRLNLTFYKPNIVECKYLPFDDTVFDSSVVVIGDTLSSFDIQVDETADRILLQTDSIIVEIKKFPVRLTYYDLSYNKILKETETFGHRMEGNQAAIYFEYESGTAVYGTGERGDNLDLAGGTYSFYNTQMYGYHGAPDVMAVNVPMITTNKGYSVYFDSHLPSTIDVASTTNNIKFSTEREHLRYFVIKGSTFADQLEKYTWLTGRQPMPPKWALGYMQSKYGYRNDNEARQMITTARAKEIPLDVVIIDWYWQNEMGDLNWNPTFNQPFDMMDEFLEMGVKTVVITEPYVSQYADKFNPADAGGYFAKNSNGETYRLGGWWSCGCDAGLIDMSNPEASQWWWDQHPSFMGSQMAGLWTDLGEPERHPGDMVHHGGTADEVHNLYNNYWAEAVFNELNQFRPNERIFNLTRAGFAGIQRYSTFTWSGDVGASWDGLKPQIAIMLNCAMSGIPFEHSDLGGFCCGNPNGTLYTRWMQLGAFSPVMRAHGVDSDPQEPWMYGSNVEKYSKAAINLRYSLLPYTYSMIRKTYEQGIPITRPLVWEDPQNSALYNEQSGFFWGDDMIAYPLSHSSFSKEIVVPSGGWVDYLTGEEYDTPGTYVENVSLFNIPLLVRKGAIIPTMPVRNYIGETPDDTLIIKCYPEFGKSSTFTLYEDDGVSNDYKNGLYAKTELRLRKEHSDSIDHPVIVLNIDAASGTYNEMPEERTWIMEIPLEVDIHMASFNGEELLYYSTMEELNNVESGYILTENNDFTLIVKIKKAANEYGEIVAVDARVGVEDNSQLLPEFKLSQNYPNPFNPVTRIEYSIPQNEYVSLTVFDMLGQVVKILVDEQKSAGSHHIHFDGAELASGIYMYKLEAGNNITTRKMMLIK